MLQKAVGIVFSPTGNTWKVVETMLLGTGLPHELLDVCGWTRPLAREFTGDDLVIVGTPVYGGRVPAVARGRLLNLKGSGTPCVVTVTYGNKTRGDALLELGDLMEERGFRIVGAAAVVGRHTFGRVQMSRPDISDLDETEQFIRKVMLKKEPSTPVLPGNRPYREGGSGGKFRPETTGLCFGCGLCAARCPTGAIAADFRSIDPDRCLSCFRCIRNCPVHAKVIRTPEYRDFAEKFSDRLQEPRANEFYF